MAKKRNGGFVPQKRGMNALDRIRASLQEQYEHRQRYETDFLLQAGCDAFLLTAADLFDLDENNALEAVNTYREYIMRMMEALIEDSRDDDELTYYWADLDRRLEQIAGKDNFVPYDKRYDDTGIRIFGDLYKRTVLKILTAKKEDGEE